MANFDRMGDYRKNQLLAFFAHEMSMEQRRKLMRQLPEAYNALVGADVVRVVKNSEKRLYVTFTSRPGEGLHPVVWKLGDRYEIVGVGTNPGVIAELNSDQVEEAKKQIADFYNPGTYEFHIVPV